MIVEFSHADSALSALQCTHPLLISGKRVIIKPRHFRLKSREPTSQGASTGGEGIVDNSADTNVSYAHDII